MSYYILPPGFDLTLATAPLYAIGCSLFTLALVKFVAKDLKRIFRRL